MKKIQYCAGGVHVVGHDCLLRTLLAMREVLVGDAKARAALCQAHDHLDVLEVNWPMDHMANGEARSQRLDSTAKKC